MGTKNSKFQLDVEVEMDEAFYETVMEKHSEKPQLKKGEHTLKRGKGSQRQSKVIVMAESFSNPNNKNKHRPSKKLGRIKMIVVDNLKSPGINHEVKREIAPTATVITDGLQGFNNVGDVVSKHIPLILVDKKESSKVFPWVNITISNSKRQLLGTNHSIGRAYLQNYLNEFCYKINHRYSGMDLFDHAINDCILAQCG